MEPLSGKSLETLAEKLARCRYEADPAAERLKQAVSFMEHGKMEQAAEIFHELIEGDAVRLDAHIGLFQVFCAWERWLEAENHILKAIEVAKESHDKIEVHRKLAAIFYRYGLFYEKRQNIEKAIKSYRTSMSLDPYSLESTKALLRLLMKRHEINEMVEVIGKTYALLPPDSRSVDELAVCVSELAVRFSDFRMNVPARRLNEQLLTIAHTRVEIHLDVAAFFVAQGQVSLVLKFLTAVSERIKDPRLYLRIGTLLLEKRTALYGKRTLGHDRQCGPQLLPGTGREKGCLPWRKTPSGMHGFSIPTTRGRSCASSVFICGVENWRRRVSVWISSRGSAVPTPTSAWRSYRGSWMSGPTISPCPGSRNRRRGFRTTPAFAACMRSTSLAGGGRPKRWGGCERAWPWSPRTQPWCLPWRICIGPLANTRTLSYIIGRRRNCFRTTSRSGKVSGNPWLRCGGPDSQNCLDNILPVFLYRRW